MGQVGASDSKIVEENQGWADGSELSLNFTCHVESNYLRDPYSRYIGRASGSSRNLVASLANCSNDDEGHFFNSLEV